ncbi:MAG: hypothetical protein KDD73_05950 [Anaerolineales bacterium]|nr:hypothetical protein [Anaerolineales bacterium]MCB9127152.1 hypothetical protein [Ardenticatenales bacterium]
MSQIQTLVLAAGRGMRLDTLTRHTPAPLLYLPGGTVLDFLFHHVRTLTLGVPMVLLQYQGDDIAAHLGESYPCHFNIIPQTPPFTLCGALASAVPHIEGPTLVLHANHYYSKSLHDAVHAADPTRPTFFQAEESTDRSQIGAYLLPQDAFYVAAQSLADGDGATLFEQLRAAGANPLIRRVPGRAMALRTITDLLNLNRYLLVNWHDVLWPDVAGVGYSALNYSWISPSAEISGRTHLSFSTIGPQSQVRDAQLANALVFPHARLSERREQCAIILGDGNGRVRELYGNPAQLEAPGCQ